MNRWFPIRSSFAARWLAPGWLVAWALFSLPWTHPTATPHWERVRAPHVNSYSRIHIDHVLNVLFYLPAAPLAVACGWPIWAGVGSAVALSIGAEGSQVFSENRAPDGNDVLANIGGAMVGALASFVYRRARLLDPDASTSSTLFPLRPAHTRDDTSQHD